jgi:hypothetical protein
MLPPRLLVASLALALTTAAGVATSASANPQATVPLTHLDCANGQSYDVYGVDSNGFLNYSSVGITDGKGVAAKWFIGHDTGVLTITHDGQDVALPYDNTFGSAGGTESRRTPEPDLTRLTECSAAADPYTFSGIVDQGLVDYLGLDPIYLGDPFTVTGTNTFSVYVNSVQLLHR